MILFVTGLSQGWLASNRDIADHVGFLATPTCGDSVETVMGSVTAIAADNDCFRGLNEKKYRKMLAKWRQAASMMKWVSAPDVVGDARTTLERFEEWEPILHTMGYPVALVGQDGLENMAVPWNRIEALFIGGSTKWKLSREAFELGVESKRRGKWLHVGRVSSLRRIEMAERMGADSIDGSHFSRWRYRIVEGVHLLRRAKWLAENQPLLWE